MKNFFLLITMLLLPKAALAQATTGVIAGRILAINGQAAAGVRVTAMEEPQSNVPVTSAVALVSIAETDSAGRYRLEDIPPGRYLVTAGPFDLLTYYPGASAAEKATAVSIAGGARVSGIDFSLVVPVSLSIRGRVTQPPNQVTTGIQVGLLGGNTGVQVSRVNPDGSFQFEKVRPGTYRLEVAGGAGVMERPIDVTVADRDVVGIELALLATVNVTGSLVVEGGGLRPRTSVSFVPYRGGRNAVSAMIGTSGTFTARLPEGEYQVSWTTLPVGYMVKSIASGATDLLNNPLRTVSGGFLQPIVLTLGVASPPPWVMLSGRIRNASSAPIPTRLTLISATASSPLVSPSIRLSTPSNIVDSLEATADADGSFVFPMVPAGTYSIKAASSLWPLASIVVSDKDLTNVDINLLRSKEVTGRVLIEGISQTTPRMSFSLADPGGSFPIATTLQREGTFKAVLPEGERRVTLSVPGFSVKSLTYGSTDLLKNPLRVAVADQAELQVILVVSAGTTFTVPTSIGGTLGGTAPIILDPRPGTSVTGRVVVDGGAPAPTFSMSFTGASSTQRATVSNGSFRIQLQPGDYRVTPTGLPSNYYLKSNKAGSQELTDRETNILSLTHSVEIVVTLGLDR